MSYSSRYADLGFTPGQFFWEYPESVPYIIPYGKKARAYKLPNVRRNTSLTQAIQDYIVKQKVY